MIKILFQVGLVVHLTGKSDLLIVHELCVWNWILCLPCLSHLQGGWYWGHSKGTASLLLTVLVEVIWRKFELLILCVSPPGNLCAVTVSISIYYRLLWFLPSSDKAVDNNGVHGWWFCGWSSRCLLQIHSHIIIWWDLTAFFVSIRLFVYLCCVTQCMNLSSICLPALLVFDF